MTERITQDTVLGRIQYGENMSCSVFWLHLPPDPSYSRLHVRHAELEGTVGSLEEVFIPVLKEFIF